MTNRPFRKPHHTISDVALVGGGTYPQPGEISLAHNGVLFLDELPEYKRSVLEVMRQPIEDRQVTISRAKFTVEYPAGFMLVAAMNPCPCGYYNHPDKDCVCAPGIVQNYLNKISGPLLDRIDLHVEVTPVSFDELAHDIPEEKSADIRERVVRARLIQEERYRENKNTHSNAQMSNKEQRKYCKIDEAGNTEYLLNEGSIYIKNKYTDQEVVLEPGQKLKVPFQKEMHKQQGVFLMEVNFLVGVREVGCAIWLHRHA